jgi:hypothetical protein
MCSDDAPKIFYWLMRRWFGFGFFEFRIFEMNWHRGGASSFIGIFVLATCSLFVLLKFGSVFAGKALRASEKYSCVASSKLQVPRGYG